MFFINEKERMIVNGDDGEVHRVGTCWPDLVIYHRYLISKRNSEEAQEMLMRIFEGEKYITNMVEASRKIQ